MANRIRIDAPAVKIQYAVLEPAGQPLERVEKLYFDSLLDFVYVELMKGLQKDYIPKRCAGTGEWKEIVEMLMIDQNQL